MGILAQYVIGILAHPGTLEGSIGILAQCLISLFLIFNKVLISFNYLFIFFFNFFHIFFLSIIFFLYSFHLFIYFFFFCHIFLDITFQRFFIGILAHLGTLEGSIGILAQCLISLFLIFNKVLISFNYLFIFFKIFSIFFSYL